MSNFIQLTEVGGFPDPGKAYFEVEDRIVVLFQVGGQFYCLDDVCTHDGGPLGEGVLDGFTIACPRHGAKFDIRDGRALTMPATQATRSYEVVVRDGAVHVRVSNEPLTPDTGTPSDTEPTSSDNISAPLTEDAVREELRKVIDPELFVNIVDLGLVYVVDIQSGTQPDRHKVLIEMTMTSPACPAGPQLIQNSKIAVGNMPSVEQVEVRIVMEPAWTPDRMTEAARDHLGIF